MGLGGQKQDRGIRMEWGLQGALRLATGILGHIFTPGPLDSALMIKPVAGALHFLKEGVPPSVRVERVRLSQGRCSLLVARADVRYSASSHWFLPLPFPAYALRCVSGCS